MKKTKEARIKAEEKKLKKIYADIEPKRRATAEGLIQRTAHLRITLDDLAEDLDANGYVEMFQQGKDNPPYERKRPAADLYTSMNTIYQKALKQLTDLLPKEAPVSRKEEDDGFDAFVNGRDDR